MYDAIQLKIKAHIKKFKYMGRQIDIQLCCRRKDGVEGWLKYMHKNILVTANYMGKDHKEIILKKNCFNKIQIKDLFFKPTESNINNKTRYDRYPVVDSSVPEVQSLDAVNVSLKKETGPH